MTVSGAPTVPPAGLKKSSTIASSTAALCRKRSLCQSEPCAPETLATPATTPVIAGATVIVRLAGVGSASPWLSVAVRVTVKIPGSW